MAPDEQDELLREALAGYSAPEPPLGMEQRVLRRITTARRYSPWRIPVWAFAGLAVAAAMIAMFIPPREQELTLPTVAPPVVVEASVPPVKRHPVTRPRRTPLTKEERALLTLLARAPDQAAEILTATEPAAIAQLSIADIEIQPLGE